jgi:UDP-N-acetylmuramoyl-L-alanyl-D-glutamate--2,6-diaminopimelate ligase
MGSRSDLRRSAGLPAWNDRAIIPESKALSVYKKKETDMAEAPGAGHGMSLSLAELIAAIPNARLPGNAAVPIQAITFDSRQVRPGSLFVAYRGVAQDGHDFVPEALARGAAAIVAERPLQGVSVPVAVVPDGREALAYLSAAWHGFPARRLTVVGITGTDGKTTTCNLLYGILTAAGCPTGLVTTVNAVVCGQAYDTGFHVTTPDSPDVQRYLADMVRAGTEFAVLEATSEGLAQHRVAACDFDVAAVTNVTHEHLYFHGTMEAYQQAKALLFHHLASAYRKPGVPKVAILNADDDSYRYLSPISADRHLSYSLGGPADVVASAVRRQPGETRFMVQSPYGRFELGTALVGDFNISNILAAASVALALGLPVEAVQQGVAGVRGVVGRMERIDEGQDFSVLVDFAHTPNALQRALETARALTQGRPGQARLDGRDRRTAGRRGDPLCRGSPARAAERHSGRDGARCRKGRRGRGPDVLPRARPGRGHPVCRGSGPPR